MSDLEAKVTRLVAAVERALERLDAQAGADVILTREDAAQQLKVSPRQLQRLVRAGRLMAHPSGIARVELERYAKTPQTKLSGTHRLALRSSVVEEAAAGRELLKLRRKRR